MNSGKRSRDNAMTLCVVPIDLDVAPDNPKKYPTLKAAAEALLDFCKLLEIPPPSFLVASGGGLHAYWLSDRVLTVDQWQPFADVLKTAALQSLLKLDPMCTGNAVQLLRVPGSRNWKLDKPRPVKLLQQSNGIAHDFATIFQPVFNAFPYTPVHHQEVSPIPVAEAFEDLPKDETLGEGIEVRELPPLPFEPIKAECGWLREAHDTGGKDYDYPQWHLTILCASFLADGHRLVHEFSNQHPDYVPEQTEAKWESKLNDRKVKNIGWPYCQTINDNGGTRHCSKCPHLAKGKSPLSIGYEAIKDEVEDKELKELGGSRPPTMRLPEGFAINKEGRLCAFFPPTTVKKKVIPGRLLVLVNNRLRDPILQFKNSVFGVGFIASMDKGNEAQVFLGATDMTKHNLSRVLSEKSITYNNDAEATKMLEKFGMSWLDKLMTEDKAVHDTGTMGWRYEDGKRTGFVYGGKFYHVNGEISPLRAAGDDDFRFWYMPTGSREAWFKAAKLLTDRKRPELDCIIAVAFAAPLTVFVGTLYGAILSLYGPPGTSKSTAQQVAAAVWGHPKQTRESLTSTSKSVQGRLGRTRNLPAYWDDVQDERHQDSLFQTMFVASEGAEGGRLNRDASYKQRLEWQTLLVACSNASFVDYLTKKQKSTTAGMRRVFEIEYVPRAIESGMINQVDASQAFAALEHNFGTVGAEYAQMLARNHEAINELVVEVTDRFTRRVKGTNEESFWWGMCGILLVGAGLAHKLGVGIDLPALEGFLHDAYQNNRLIRAAEGTEGGTYLHTEMTLTAFLNKCASSGHMLFVDRAFENSKKPIEPLGGHQPGRALFVQVTRDTRTILISKRAFKVHLEDHHIQPRAVFEGLIKHFNAKPVRLTIGAGTVHALAQEHCFELVVPAAHPIFDHLVEAWGAAKKEEES
jgi:hypothetical protein